MTSLLHHDLARRVVSPQEVLDFDALLGRIGKNQSPLIAHPVHDPGAENPIHRHGLPRSMQPLFKADASRAH